MSTIIAQAMSSINHYQYLANYFTTRTAALLVGENAGVQQPSKPALLNFYHNVISKVHEHISWAIERNRIYEPE